MNGQAVAMGRVPTSIYSQKQAIEVLAYSHGWVSGFIAGFVCGAVLVLLGLLLY